MHLSSEAVDLTVVAQDLKKHEQLIRLKKLLYYTCQNIWENNVKVLSKLKLEHLLEELIAKNATIEDLSESLYSSIETLNRQEIYSELANLIIGKLGRIYEDSRDSTEVIMVKPQVEETYSPALIESIFVTTYVSKI